MNQLCRRTINQNIMIKEKIIVDNLKCGGCKNTILKKVNDIKGVSNATVDIETSEVTFERADNVALENVLNVLSKLGYPKQGTTNTFQKAKSYMSCMIGRVDTN